MRPLRDEVVDVLAPVLDGDVADLRALLRDELDYRGVEHGLLIHRRGAALDVVDLTVGLRHDERPLELPHPLRVDPEVGLEWHGDLDALRDVDERPVAPNRAVEGRELVVVRGDDSPDVLLDELRIVLDRVADASEDDALRLQILLEAVVDLLALVDGAHAGEELPLGLGDAQLLEGVANLRGDVLPFLRRLFRGLRVVVKVLELYRREVDSPGGDGLLVEVLERLEPELLHPDGLVPQPRDLLDDVLVDALVALVEVAG